MGEQRVIDLGDLTLDELDAVEAAKADHGVGYTVAAALVWHRRDDPTFTVEAARALRARDVSIIDTSGDVGDRPTPAR